MDSAIRSHRILKMIVLPACMASVLGFSAAGCSFGGGDGSVSPVAQAKAKENFKKRFASEEPTKSPRTPR